MLKRKQPAPDPFKPPPPHGLSRNHTWYPHADAIRVAFERPRWMNIDDNIDWYIIRMAETNAKPTSQQWLLWLLEDTARSEERMRAAQADEPEFKEDGTPVAWGNIEHFFRPLNEEPPGTQR